MRNSKIPRDGCPLWAFFSDPRCNLPIAGRMRLPEKSALSPNSGTARPWLLYSLSFGAAGESSEYLTTVGIPYDFVPGYSAIPEIHQSVNSLVYRYLNIPEQCLRFWHSGCYFNVQHEIPYETKNDSHQ